MSEHFVFKVCFFQDSTYEVVKVFDDGEQYSVFQGSLTDCNAFINLNDRGYMDG